MNRGMATAPVGIYLKICPTVGYAPSHCVCRIIQVSSSNTSSLMFPLLHASITVWNHGMATVPLSEMGTLFAISSPPRTSSSSKRFRFRNIYFRISRLFYSRFSLRVFRPVAAVASSPARSHGTAELNDNKPKRITRVTLVNY